MQKSPNKRGHKKAKRYSDFRTCPHTSHACVMPQLIVNSSTNHDHVHDPHVSKGQHHDAYSSGPLNESGEIITHTEVAAAHRLQVKLLLVCMHAL